MGSQFLGSHYDMQNMRQLKRVAFESFLLTMNRIAQSCMHRLFQYQIDVESRLVVHQSWLFHAHWTHRSDKEECINISSAYCFMLYLSLNTFETMVSDEANQYVCRYHPT